MGYEVTHFFTNGIDFPDFCGVSRETLDEQTVSLCLYHISTTHRTLSAYSCNHIINLLHLIPFRELHFGDTLFGKTEGSPTSQTAEMGVAVIVVTMMMRVTHLITCRSATVINGVEQVMLLEKGECAEYGRAVGRIKHIFYLPECKCLTCLHKAFKNQQAHSRRLDATRLQQLHEIQLRISRHDYFFFRVVVFFVVLDFLVILRASCVANVLAK